MRRALPARDAREFDVAIVGAGPAGLAAAIRLKQLSASLDVVVVEKASEVGAHMLSGAVIDPVGFDRLLPDWRTDDTCPITQPVTEDRFYWLGEKMAVRIPRFLMPPLMRNQGNFIGSLGDVCRWLGKKAEALGVQIYCGFPVSDVLYGSGGEVIGVATGDAGIDENGDPQAGLARRIEVRGKYTLLAEGARGSLTKEIIARFSLDWDRDPQKFGIGVEELWQVQADKHHPGLIQHPSVGAQYARWRHKTAVRRAGHYRRRLAIGAEARLPGRRPDRVCRGIHECGAHQRKSQRDLVSRPCRRALCHRAGGGSGA